MALTSKTRAVTALVALLALPRMALADGGCRSCTESLACAWVCTFGLSFFALPTWLLFVVASAALNPRFRKVRPHLFSLPISFVGPALAVPLAAASASPSWLGLVVLPLPLLLWYVALARVPALRWFTERKVGRTTEWRRRQTGL